jgi:ABC-2 type transport system permease protein
VSTYFFRYEIRYWLRGAMVWVFFGIIALMFFGAASTDSIVVGGTLSNTYRNAPFVIENYYALASVLTLLMTTAFVNSAASRDFASNTWQILFSTPLKKSDFLAGRYLGSVVVSAIPILGVSAGILLAKYMPWADAERWGPVSWQAHLQGIFVFAVPNTLFIAAVIFAIAVLTRSTTVSFVGSLILLVAYAIAQTLTSDLKNETLAALTDPFAINTYALATKYWTVAEKNRMTLGFTGPLLWNRLIWLAVGALIFGFAYRRFRFTERGSKPGRKASAADKLAAAVSRPSPAFSFGAGAHAAQFLRSLRFELKGLFKSTVFIVIGLAALLNCLAALIFNATEGLGDVSFPVTYNMIALVQGALYLFLFATTIYYAGVLVWQERDAHVNDIYDSLPHPQWPIYAAKLAALLCAVGAIQVIALVTCIAVQLAHGFTRIQPGLYVETLFGIGATTLVFTAILAFFIHVLSPNKYVGYFALIGFTVVNLFAWEPLHVATLLVQFGARPDMTYSDFFGYGPYWKSWLWFTAYWAAFCVLLAVLSLGLWRRGWETGWRARLHEASLRLRGSLAITGVAAALVFAALGIWIFYNTEVLNSVRSDHDSEVLLTDYEKQYKRYEKITQPRVTDVKYAIDLRPEAGAMTMHGSETVKNETSRPLGELHFTLADRQDYTSDLQIPGGQVAKDDTRLGYLIYQLQPPMQPGETRAIEFTVSTRRAGFQNAITNARVVSNGTFFDSAVAPQIGYQPNNELLDRNKRKKYGLKEKAELPPLERNCTQDCMNAYISNNSDWVNVDTVISTAPDQIAIAPGSLIRQWTANGRRYSEYKLDHVGFNYYSFLSARYTVARDNWNGVSIEVYYLKEHPWNVPKMLSAVRQSLEYYSRNFGPYPQKEARIIEFPRVASFAQGFQGTMPYAESVGFIANLEHPDDIDKVYYVVAHEMGHQWWAHQVIGANMEGATSLSETLAQYSALMVMEKQYGRDAMRKFLQYEMDDYLKARGKELLKERPLLRVQASQGYVHYSKGAVVMYYLRDLIGEDAVNTALRNVLQHYGYAPPPYPVSYALTDALTAQTPPELQYLIKDLFYDITLFSNRTLEATAHKRPDGKYDVAVKIEAHKFKADDQGNETEVPLNDWIEIGALAAPETGKKYGVVLHRERVHMTSHTGSYTFVSDKLPEKAGVDPLSMLVDRIPADNLKNVVIR